MMLIELLNSNDVVDIYHESITLRHMSMLNENFALRFIMAVRLMKIETEYSRPTNINIEMLCEFHSFRKYKLSMN